MKSFIFTSLLLICVYFLNAQTVNISSPSPTLNYIPVYKFIGSGTTATLIGNSSLYQNGTNLFVGNNACFMQPSASSSAYIRAGNGFSTAVTPDYTWWNNDQVGLFHPALNIMGFTTGGTERMRIDDKGFVGIGETAPIAKLQVSGGDILATSGMLMSGLKNSTQIRLNSDGANYGIIQNNVQDKWSLGYKATADQTLGTGVLYWTATGAVGIGTASPEKTLAVNGDVRFLKTDGLLSINSGFEILSGGIPSRRGISIPADPNGQFNFYIHQWQPNSSFNFINGYNNQNLMKILSNGNVGIGTTTPNALLDIRDANYNPAGHPASSTCVQVRNTLSTLVSGADIGGSIYFGFDITDGGPYGNNNPTAAIETSWGGVDAFTPQIGIGVIRNGAKANILMTYENKTYFKNGSTTTMYIDNNGNVGIGTLDTKGYQLAVKGLKGIVAEQITVMPSGSWSDYVFETNYKLNTLNEVEKYIKENKHLPDVPSTKEVDEKGIDLGKMDATLLRKIEELTLYTIELQKQVDALKAAQANR